MSVSMIEGADHRMKMSAVEADWNFLWEALGDENFCSQFWERYVAVFSGQVLGSGATDEEARKGASAVLSNQGIQIDPKRFCVDFVGE